MIHSICEAGQAAFWLTIFAQFLIYVSAATIGTMLAFKISDWMGL